MLATYFIFRCQADTTIVGIVQVTLLKREYDTVGIIGLASRMGGAIVSRKVATCWPEMVRSTVDTYPVFPKLRQIAASRVLAGVIDKVEKWLVLSFITTLERHKWSLGIVRS